MARPDGIPGSGVTVNLLSQGSKRNLDTFLYQMTPQRREALKPFLVTKCHCAHSKIGGRLTGKGFFFCCFFFIDVSSCIIWHICVLQSLWAIIVHLSKGHLLRFLQVVLGIHLNRAAVTISKFETAICR